MPQHKTRKQLRQDAQAAEQKLALLDTPEGFAALIVEKQRSSTPEFRDAVQREIERLSKEQLEAVEGELDESLEEVAAVAE